MTHVICEPCKCTKDRSCVTACPVGCIHEAADQLVIDPLGCVDCGACIAVCPVSAIFPAVRVPSEWRHYTGLNAELAATRARGGLR